METQKTRSLVIGVNILSILLVLLSANLVFSRPLTGSSVTVKYGTYGKTQGGEFDITVSGYNVNFIGFCLELDESIKQKTYSLKSAVDYSEKGGTAGQTSGTNRDPLSAASKWVYWNYFNGTFGERSDQLANDVQRTIWALEDESDSYFLRNDYINPVTDNKYGSSIFYRDYITSKGWLINDTSKWVISGDVYALNIGEWVDEVWIHKQSIIVGEPVPEPATMLLFGAGLVGLAGFSYRRKKK